MTDITSQDVINAFIDADRMAVEDKAVVSSYRQMVRDMREEETRILDSSLKECSKRYVDDTLESMDENALGYELNNKFDNPNVMKVGKCVTESITKGRYYKAPDGDNAANVEVANNISTWFTSQKQIGADSIEGIAMSTSLKSLGGMAILKAPKNPKSTDLIHEMFVGMYGTNKAREDIPNFAYIYGGFKCPSPVIDPKTNEVVSLCGNSENPDVQYVIYENIAPGKPAQDMAGTIGPMEYLSMILQIALATEYGAIKFGWTHFDLHDENVILRDVSAAIASRSNEKDFFIRYPLGDKDIYIRSKHVATIIDYGRSHIVSEGRDYGYFLMQAGIYPDVMYPMFDVYKFLMFSVFSMIQKGGNENTIKVANILYKYFNQSQNVVSAAKEQRKAFYNLPYSERAVSLSVFGFIEHIWKYLPKMMETLYVTDASKLGNLPVLGCSNLSGSCSTVTGLLKNVGLDKISSKSILGFYEQVRIFENSDGSGGSDVEKTLSMQNGSGGSDVAKTLSMQNGGYIDASNIKSSIQSGSYMDTSSARTPVQNGSYMDTSSFGSFGSQRGYTKQNEVDVVVPTPDLSKYEQLVRNFESLYPEAMVKHRLQTEVLLNEFRMGKESAEQNARGINPQTMAQGTVDQLIAPDTYDVVRNYLTQLSLFRTVAQKLALYINAGAYTAKVYRDEQSYNHFLALKLEYSNIFSRIEQLYANGKKVAMQFVRIANSKEGKAIISRNKKLRWFMRDILYNI